jgi:hypothetical protein
VKFTVREQKPRAIPPQFSAMPSELTRRHTWVLWRWTWTEDRHGGKWDKPPFDPDGNLASSTNAATWRPFEDVVLAYDRGGWNGVGHRLTEPIVGVDLDDVVDPETGVIAPEARAIVDQAPPLPSPEASPTAVQGPPPVALSPALRADLVSLLADALVERYRQVTAGNGRIPVGPRP